VADSRTHILSGNNYVLGKQVTATGAAGLELRLSDAFYIRTEWQDFARFSHVASNVSFSTLSLIAHF